MWINSPKATRYIENQKPKAAEKIRMFCHKNAKECTDWSWSGPINGKENALTVTGAKPYWING